MKKGTYLLKLKYLLLTVYDVFNCLFSRLFLSQEVRTFRESLSKEVWLFSEQGNSARDNAYIFYLYVRKHHPEIAAYYVIDKSVSDAKKLNRDKNVIDFESRMHKKVFLAADVLISAYFRGSIEPWRQRIFPFMYRGYFKKKYVFVQHGIIKDDMSVMISKEHENYDLMICGAKPEYDYLLETLGYSKKELVYTGLARYDQLNTYYLKNQILVMPTWRRYIVENLHGSQEEKDDVFCASNYYQHYQELLNNKVLHSFLEKNDLNLVFYQHAQMQEYTHLFTSTSKRMIIATAKEYDVQSLLKESRLLITDYSSVFFDFAYMHKPALFYQFDEDEFFSKHHKKGYFHYRRDGFGPVCTDLKQINTHIAEVAEANFEMAPEYLHRTERFFVLHDDHNCDRIFNEIKKLQ